MGLTTAAMTAFYMWRLMNMTFYGKSRVAPEVASHIHESPVSMTGPLTVLAVGSVFAGWLGVPKLWTAFGENFRGFEHWLEPVFATAAVEAAKEGEHSASIEWTLMFTSIGIAIAGILIARYFYHREARDPRCASAPCSRAAIASLSNKWYSTRSTISCSSTDCAKAAACCSAPSTATWWMAA